MGMRISVVEVEVLRPGELDAPGHEPFLERADAFRPGVDVAWRQTRIQTVGTQRARRLADVPLHRMQPVAAVGQML
jgi:hypothetical protein